MEKVKPEKRAQLMTTKRVHQNKVFQETMSRGGLFLRPKPLGPFITWARRRGYGSLWGRREATQEEETAFRVVLVLFLFIHKIRT